MSEFGIKIKNIKAATLYGYNLGIRDRFDYTDAMFSKSLFSNYIIKNGMKVTKADSTRDIICLEFDFGSRSFDEEVEHINKLLRNAADDESRQRLQLVADRIMENEGLYRKKNKEEIREYFYDEDVDVEYKKINKKTGEVTATEVINYRMLYRNASKAKTGQVMFINTTLYDKAYDWITMGLGKKLPEDNAKIVEISAYAPLVTSTIVDTVHIPVEDILILKDQDSFFNTVVDIVKAEDYETVEHGETVVRKKCVVERARADVKNTLWDGMAIVESEVFPEWVNGMGLLRNHFFKTCGIRGHIQMFFRDWCEKNGCDYESYTVKDMFGVEHYLKDIKMITTDNSIKWKKFADLMGDTLAAAYKYWCDRINADGSVFGIVKTDHESKLGEVQQMSYQMVNTLPCTYDDIKELASTSIKYVELIKTNNDEFVKFLLKNKNEINNYEMLAALYHHNPDISKTKWFKTEKRKIINGYVNKLRKGKITINADNLTIFGNPYALLLYSVGEDFNNDPVFQHEDGCIQCYTRRFEADEYLAAFRNPHNSPNNVCYFHNVGSGLMDKYFIFSPNIMAVNCIKTDIQDRANGCDFDSDFMFVTNNPVAVKCAKKCYNEYPTTVNKIKESGITYSNTKKEYARMDNKFARSQRYIGESSNLAQLAMTYYWTDRANHVEFSFRSKELYDNFVILAVLA